MATDLCAELLAALRGPYGLEGPCQCLPLGSGHINTTRLIRHGDRALVAQRINRAVFRDPALLVRNALRVERHLVGRADYPLAVLRQLPGRGGRYLHGPEANMRVLNYFPGSLSLEVASSPQEAELAAQAYGRFAAALSDLEPQALAPAIAGFHDLALRFRQFREAVAADRNGRGADCRPEIDTLEDQEPLLQEWREQVSALPLRICHADTKLNNLLWSEETRRPLAVVDLDTCGPGYLMMDYGDLVRSCVSPEPEDSTDLQRVRARPDYLAALYRGYIGGLGGTASAVEIDSLQLGPRVSACMLALRFLTDHLEGDVYFPVRRPGHNLERARNQLALCRSLDAAGSRHGGETG